MKRTIPILLLSLLFAACTSFGDDAYEGDVHRLVVQAAYPAGWETHLRAGVEVRVSEVSAGIGYTSTTDERGVAEFRLANGIYRVAVSDRPLPTAVFNGSAERVQVIDADRQLTLPLTYSRTSALVIKEIYCGGCSRAPEQGTFNYDQYVILHNNSAETVYLDGLCFGCADPYNSTAGGGNVWVDIDPDTGETVFPGYVPVIQAVWQFSGGGRDFPLAPGADAVISINGALDHAAQYPQSVNLNREAYFVLYNEAEFPNTSYHPTPGDRILRSHYLRVAAKLGQANAYTYSQNSPATVIFRPVGMTIDEFLADPANVRQKPGSPVDRCALVPEAWIEDGVEVFATPSDRVKRLSAEVDAGFAVLSETKKSHTVHRHLDEEATAEAGYEVYVDTNNSSNDFYERATQSLRDL